MTSTPAAKPATPTAPPVVPPVLGASEMAPPPPPPLTSPRVFVPAPGPAPEVVGSDTSGSATTSSAGEEKDPRVPLSEGSVLGEYTVTKRLGQGGFGITYLARHSREGSIVVIKEHMPKGLAIREPDSSYVISTSPETEELLRATMDEFASEVLVLRGLEHPGIVPILASFEKNGTAYYVMPYLQGKPLEPEDHPSLDNASRRREARTIRQQLFFMLDTLDYMEQHNIVHRDIKPENIMRLDEDGRLILLDFGSARQPHSGKVFTNIYTPEFCAPEQATAANDSDMSAKLGMWTDIYSLGATFHYLITRLMPPRAEMRGYAEQDPYKPLASRSDLVRIYGSAFLQSIDRAMELRPRDRWQTAAAWRDSISQGIVPPPPRQLRRMRWIMALSVSAMAILGGISLWALMERNQAVQIYNQSLHFTENFLFDFNEELSDVPGATVLQGQLVTQLKNYLDGMEQLSVGSDEKVRRALASAWRNLGYVYTERGDLEASTKALLRATELQAALVEDFPDNLRYRYDMARTWLYRAEVARRRSMNGEASALVSQAMMTLRELCAKSPGNSDYSCMLGRAMELTAALAALAGNEELRKNAITEMLALYRSLVAKYPQNSDARMGLAYALQSSGSLAMTGEDYAASENSLEESRQIFSALVNSNPYRLSFKKGLASTYYAIGSLRTAFGASLKNEGERKRSDALALGNYTRYLGLVQELIDLDPGNAEYPFLQCKTMALMLDILLRNDHDNRAMAYSRAILDRTKQLLETAPDNADYAMLKAKALQGLAVAHSRSDRYQAQAADEFSEARGVLEKLLEQSPDNRAMQLMYADLLAESAEYAGRGSSASRIWLQRALLILRKLIQENPGNKSLPGKLKKMQELLGGLTGESNGASGEEKDEK